MCAKKLAPKAPDFYCIGAQKAGTTWLHSNLRRHPDIWLPPVKEVQYFNQVHVPGHAQWTQWHRDEHAGRSLRNYFRNNEEYNFFYVRMLATITDPAVDDDWYRNVFSYAGPDRLAGDLTPEYSLLPKAGIEHMLTLSPDAKFLFIMRDPISRSWSHVRMLMKRQGSDRGHPQALLDQPDVFARSDYPAILDRWQGCVPESNLMVGFFDEISASPQPFLRKVIEFIGLEFEPDHYGDLDKVVHKGEAAEIPGDIYDGLRRSYEPIYRELEKRFPGIAGNWMATHYG
ncbi:sulfotransferase family protein [Marinibacterium sp. SX1]|uniref:sulfotransferase family protein n=1 Tax=Marinibacterium sp. SX1 TaxID=3388424 RepID=UPI003D1783E0